MNIQTERLDNHTARLTVEVEPERFAQAKQKAARKIAQKVNLPGFRKGKAPYNILARFVGESVIIEEAVEIITSDLYASIIKEAGIDTYGPGTVEDFSSEDPMSIVFLVSLQPTVDLKNYRAVRLPYEEPAVSDREVEEALKRLLQDEAVVEESNEPAAMGDQVTLNIHSHIEDSEEEDATNTGFIHEHALDFVLDADDDLLPGFSEKIVGAATDSDLEFDLTVPEDSEEYPEQRGKAAHFEVTVIKVNHITLPALNDEFAARMTADDEDGPLTLLQLRLRLRERLTEEGTNRYHDDYGGRVIDLIIEQADIRFPEAAVTNEITSMVETMDEQLRRHGMNLEDYKKLTSKTDEDMFDSFHNTAVLRIRRGLTRRVIFEAEQLEPTDEDVNDELTRLIGEVNDEQAGLIRKMFESEGMFESLREQLSERKLRERVVAIGKGEAPELPELPEAQAELETVTEPNPETTDDSEETA